tara:strand:- start:62 stop:442 length:381 start_codon:yes stop_codon:yes gene_type:complete
MLLRLLDVILDFLHIMVIVINSSFWVHPRTRLLHKYVIHLTAVSWLFLGLWFGSIGYCFLTDVQWRVKEALGEGPLPSSYLIYLCERFFNYRLEPFIADLVAGIVFFVALFASWLMTWRDSRQKIS